MSTTSGTVRALAEQLAHDDVLRARLIGEPQAVLDEWGLSTAGDVVPDTINLPTAAELAGLATASDEEPEVHEPDPPEVHEAEEPEIHGADTEIHGPDTEIHGPDTEIHGPDTEIHGPDTPAEAD